MNNFALKSRLISNKPYHNNDVYNTSLDHNFALRGPVSIDDGPNVIYGSNLHIDDGS